MSVQAISWVLENSESRLGARHVLISIANHAQSDGTGSWPSIATIGRESKLSEREVRYALRELEEMGELHTEIASGPRGCNMYTLQNMPGANFAGGKILPKIGGEGGKILPGGGQPSAPEPSLPVLKENRPYMFPKFWEEYPNKQGGELAAKGAWIKVLGEHYASEIFVGLAQWKKRKWETSEGRDYIPYAEKWLYKRQWKTPPEEIGGINNERMEKIRASRQ